VQVLLILNDPPYGTERCYNGSRLALALAKSDPAISVTVFLMADAVVAPKSGQKTPDGYYNVERRTRDDHSFRRQGVGVLNRRFTSTITRARPSRTRSIK
jgi:sulfur relay (sulfurtransferase) complex TusBCD TusD component (DsrE family)